MSADLGRLQDNNTGDDSAAAAAAHGHRAPDADASHHGSSDPSSASFSSPQPAVRILNAETASLSGSQRPLNLELWNDAIRYYPVGTQVTSQAAQCLPLNSIVGAEAKSLPARSPSSGGLFGRMSQQQPQQQKPEPLIIPTLVVIYAFFDATVLRAQQRELKAAAIGQALSVAMAVTPTAKQQQRNQEVLRFMINGPDSARRAHVWCQALNAALRGLRSSPERLLIFVNPASGNGAAVDIWKSVEDMFSIAGVQTSVLLTKGPCHAARIMSGEEPVFEADADGHELVPPSRNSSLNNDGVRATATARSIADFDGVIVVSGDGLIQEVVQGLKQNPNFETLQRTLTIGVIPGGSGNAVAASAGVIRPVDAAWAIVRGRSVAWDLFQTDLVRIPEKINGYKTKLDAPFELDPSSLELVSPSPYFGCLQFVWAVIAEIDRDSEKMRWLGGTRFDVEGVFKVLGKRNPNECSLMQFPVATHWDKAAHQFKALGSEPCHPVCHICDKNSKGHSHDEHLNIAVPSVGDFSFLTATNLSMMTKKDIGSTRAHFSDGSLDCLTAHALSKPQLTKLLLSLETGGFEQNSLVNVAKIWSIVLHPKPGTARRARQYYSVDGEYPYSDAFFEVLGLPVPPEYDEEDIAVRVTVLPAHLRFYRGVDVAPPFYASRRA